jgi:ComF family protein
MFSIFKDIFNLFFPPLCPACGRVMETGGGFLCTACQYDMPLTGYENMADNPVARRFWGLLPLQGATAFVWFVDESGFRRVVHRFKYSGQWALARDMGRWFGRVLADTDAYAGVDVIVPVPLHTRKVLKRGYNQSEYIARGMSAEMGVAVETRAVVRHVNNRSQTSTRGAEERWENVEGIFAVRHPERLKGRHILLVDDVLTTGATIGSCAEAILAAVPSCRVSVAALYASKQGLGVKD